MTPFENLALTHSGTGLTAVYGSRLGEQYQAQFSTADDLWKALKGAGVRLVTDRYLLSDQLKARQDVVAAAYATPEQLSKAGFVKAS